MWSLSGAARKLTVLAALAALQSAAGGASAQTYNNGYYPGYNNQTYSYGLTLPQVPQPNGQDEIRAGDGTTCRSSMASNNAYLDVGGIGGQGMDGSFDSGTLYGRIIVPLGGVPNRLDCSSLYNLEIERLKHELDMVRAGASSGTQSLSSATVPGGRDKAWAETGWSTGKVASKDKGASSAKGMMVPTSGSTSEKKPVIADGVVPQHLGGLVPAAASSAPASDVEILPWSTTPAEPARVLTGMPAPKLVRVDTETAGELSRPNR